MAEREMVAGCIGCFGPGVLDRVDCKARESRGGLKEGDGDR